MPRRLKDRAKSDHPAKKAGHVATPTPPPTVVPGIPVEVTPSAYVIDGREYQRVTKAIKGGVPAPALQFWGQKVVAEASVDAYQSGMLDNLVAEGGKAGAVDWLKRAPFRSTDAAGRQGTNVHAWAEHRLQGSPLPDGWEKPEADSPLDRMMGHVDDVLQRFLPPEDWVYTEATVWSEEHGYAGTLDGLAEVKSEAFAKGIGWMQDRAPRVLLDWKTSRGVYPDHALQLSAYRHADHLLNPVTGDVEILPSPRTQEEPGSWVDLAAIIHVRPDGWGIYPAEAGEQVFDIFLAAMQVSRWDAMGKEVLASHPSLRG